MAMLLPDKGSVQGSLYAALRGWGGGAIYLFIGIIFNLPFHSLAMEPAFPFPLALAVALVVSILFVGSYLLLVWLAIILPLYAFVPRRRLLWHPLVFTAVVAILSPVILYDAIGHLGPLLMDLNVSAQERILTCSLIVAAITGGIAGYTATRNVDTYRGRG